MCSVKNNTTMSVSLVVDNVRAGRLLFVLLSAVISCTAIDVKLSDCAGPENKTSLSVEACPPNSECTLVDSTFKCLCLPNFQQNTNLDSRPSSNFEFMAYCQPKNASTSSSVFRDAIPVIYNRPSARVEHLVFAILVVLLSVILAVAIIYLIKMFQPLKITKVAYVKLKRRGNKHEQLMEGVFDEIPMTPRNNEDK